MDIIPLNCILKEKNIYQNRTRENSVINFNFGSIGLMKIKAMPIQYLKDKHNNTTAVVIPISDWEKIIETHQDINLMLQAQKETP